MTRLDGHSPKGKRPPARLVSQDEIYRRAQKIRLLAMDVDGVLTDGSIIVLDSGEEVKYWNVRDRIGFFMMRRASRKFHTAWITGRKSLQVETRAKEIGLDALYQNCEDKGAAFLETAQKLGVKPEESLFIGDDL